MRRNQLLPWNAFAALDRNFGRLLDGFAPHSADTPTTAAPALDVVETDTTFRVTVDLPGVSEDDVKISLDDGVLDLSAEKRTEERSDDETVRHFERRVQRFRRRLALPGEIDADAVEATLENGVLQVVLPKAAVAQPRQIEVRRKGE